MSDRVIDINKARHIRTSMRDVALLERVAGTGLDLDLHRVGGIRGLFEPSGARGTLEIRRDVYNRLVAFGISEEEMLNALTDSLTRRGGTQAMAELYMKTTLTIYRASPEVVATLKSWGITD